VKGGQLLHTFTGHDSNVWSVAFSPDGQTLATGSWDKTAKLWAVKGGQLLHTFTGHDSYVSSVAFSPDGQILATGSADKSAKLWRVFKIPELIDYANRIVPRCLTPTQRQTFFLPPNKAEELIAAGEDLAKQGHLTEAIKQFKQAQQLAPCFKADPQAQTKQLAAQAKIEQGEGLAQDGKIAAAVAEFKQALGIDSRFKLNNLERYAQGLAALAFVDKGVELAKKGEIDAALAQFQAALKFKPNLKIDAYQWDILCQYGIAYGQAAPVMAACNQAVALKPNYWKYLRNRGIANALLGKTACAIEDLQQAANLRFFETDEENYQLVQGWVDALQAGNNPFTEEVLKTLR
jgi:tetratricopeptide (TPR) repeat protein